MHLMKPLLFHSQFLSLLDAVNLMQRHWHSVFPFVLLFHKSDLSRHQIHVVESKQQFQFVSGLFLFLFGLRLVLVLLFVPPFAFGLLFVVEVHLLYQRIDFVIERVCVNLFFMRLAVQVFFILLVFFDLVLADVAMVQVHWHTRFEIVALWLDLLQVLQVLDPLRFVKSFVNQDVLILTVCQHCVCA